MRHDALNGEISRLIDGDGWNLGVIAPKNDEQGFASAFDGDSLECRLSVHQSTPQICPCTCSGFTFGRYCTSTRSPGLSVGSIESKLRRRQ